MVSPNAKPAQRPNDAEAKGDEVGTVGACTAMSNTDRMPISEGVVQGKKITVLRDCGANTVLIKRSLVRDEDLTGKKSQVIFADSTIKWLPEAIIEISTPYFSGKVSAKCLDNPIHDLILVNVPGVRDVDTPDPQWICKAEIEHKGSSRIRSQKLHKTNGDYPHIGYAQLEMSAAVEATVKVGEEQTTPKASLNRLS
ncbi:hypothetical protein HPB48_013190 [Haemaphysalis longicornis]|uniref:Uncharacterized protein n=1 Tax=Haemaphysalis longicornis TaxID=44386 RepID=A0A9J6FEP6_HAELO|nr:hypothetical protein HPB48_013190 [Haemaphysalis longicornis]